jgi:hypothetical protein
MCSGICEVRCSCCARSGDNTLTWCHRFAFPPAASGDAAAAIKESSAGAASVELRTNGHLQAGYCVLLRCFHFYDFAVALRALETLLSCADKLFQGETLKWNHCSVLYASKWDAGYLCALFKV